MSRLLFMLFILAAPLCAEPAAPLPPRPEAERPTWQAIARVQKNAAYGPGFCTGTLIAPDVVLTAAHCASPSRHITLAPHEGTDKGRIPVASAKRHPAYKIGGRHSPFFDLGLLFLERPAEGITPFPLAPLTSPPPADAALIGYHAFLPFRLTGRTNCPLLSQTAQLLFLGCRVISGNSGSPVLTQTPEGTWQIIAVTSSQSGPNAIAATLDDWLFETLSAHQSPSN